MNTKSDPRVRTLAQQGNLTQADMFDLMNFVTFVLITIVALACGILGLFFFPDLRPTLAIIVTVFTVVAGAVNAGIMHLCFNPKNHKKRG